MLLYAAMLAALTNPTVLTIASIFALRTFGFFIVLPIFSLAAGEYADATPLLIGTAFGIYGLTQAILQIPLGFLSDRYGRLPILLTGLLLLIIGSIVAALATNIYGVLLGRALQGAGAIGSTLMALMADVTDEEQRTPAMAVIGMGIGLSFLLAIVIGSVFYTWIGLSGIFWLTAVFGLLAIVLLYASGLARKTLLYPVKTPLSKTHFKQLLTDRNLHILDISIFIQHAIFASLFFCLPLLLTDMFAIHTEQQWQFYTILLVASFICMMPLMRFTKHIGYQQRILCYTVAGVSFTLLTLPFFTASFYVFSTILFIYFICFNFLEANLPSLLSKLVNKQSKGGAMGLYSSAQFLGIFFGGVLAGWIYQVTSLSWIFFVCAIMGALWFYLIRRLDLSTQEKQTSYELTNGEHHGTRY